MPIDDLLPDNSTALERGLLNGFYELLRGIENPYPNLRNPDLVREDLLPYLAQERLVPEWDSNASESERREIVGSSWQIKSIAGTKKSVRLAVESLGHDAEVIPWYEMSPGGDPFYFQVIAYRRDNAPVDNSIISRMIQHIDEAKSRRDNYDLFFAFSLSSQMSIAGGVSSGVSISDHRFGAGFLSLSELVGGVSLLGVVDFGSVFDLSVSARFVGGGDLLGALSAFGGVSSLSVLNLELVAKYA